MPRRNKVRAVGTLLREVHHRETEVVRRAAVRIELDLVAFDLPLLRERGVEAALIRMAFAGDVHVGVAVEDESHRTIENPRRDRRRRIDHERARLLAAESAAEGTLKNGDGAVVDVEK